jgi:hypothetical protein
LSNDDRLEEGKTYQVIVRRRDSIGELNVNGTLITSPKSLSTSSGGSSSDSIHLGTELYVGGIAPGVGITRQMGNADSFTSFDGCILMPVRNFDNCNICKFLQLSKFT